MKVRRWQNNYFEERLLVPFDILVIFNIFLAQTHFIYFYYFSSCLPRLTFVYWSIQSDPLHIVSIDSVLLLSFSLPFFVFSICPWFGQYVLGGVQFGGVLPDKSLSAVPLVTALVAWPVIHFDVCELCSPQCWFQVLLATLKLPSCHGDRLIDSLLSTNLANSGEQQQALPINSIATQRMPCALYTEKH